MTASTRQEIRHRDRCGSKARAAGFRGSLLPMHDACFQELARLIDAAVFLHGERETRQAIADAFVAIGLDPKED